jgi:hypothetical protein
VRRVISKSIVCIVSLTVVIWLIGNSLPAATTQGTAGTTSTGTVDIDVRVGGDIRIYGLQTVRFDTWGNADGDLASNQDIGIGKFGFPQPHAAQASGDGTAGDPSVFTLSNGVDQINYDVYWNDQNGTGDQIPLSSGSVEYGQAGLVADFFGIGCLALLDFLVALVHLRLMPIVRDEFPPQHYRQLQEDSIVAS